LAARSLDNGMASPHRWEALHVTTESTSTAGLPADHAASTPPPSDDQGLRRLLKYLVIATVIIVVVFGTVYYLTQRTTSGPTLMERATETAESAVKENPNDIGARLSLAATYMQAERPDDALTQFEEIIKAEPKHRAALIGAGTIYFSRNDFSAAKKNFESVVKASGTGEFSNADPQLEESLYYLGVSDLRLGDVPGAVKNLQSAVRIDDTDADAWYQLGSAQVQAGDYKGAATAFQTALTFIPAGWCDPYDGLSTAYDKLKQVDGVTYAKAMATICKGDAETGMNQLKPLTNGEFKIPALIGLGVAAEAAKDTKAATNWYQQVVAVDPTNVAALNGLARLGATPQHGKASSTPNPAASTS
jgi:tetratricopeptide (TPR) repeat protein